MNEKILRLALDAGLLNYVDLETPRRYFISGHADIEEVHEFAKLIIQECAKIADRYADENLRLLPSEEMKKKFGL
jgi:hypothetical protein